MTHIHLITKINAPIVSVFDHSRNIDVHQKSTSKTQEKAIAGITNGLIGLHETVTWSGIHFGIRLKHTSKITHLEFPTYFVDEMIHGHFKSFKHEHYFKEENGMTVMEDHLYYETPFGLFGKLFDRIALKKHLISFLMYRNKVLQEISEKN